MRAALAAVTVEDADIDRALHRLRKRLQGQRLTDKSAHTRRFISKQDQRRMRLAAQESRRRRNQRRREQANGK